MPCTLSLFEGAMMMLVEGVMMMSELFFQDEMLIRIIAVHSAFHMRMCVRDILGELHQQD